MPHRLVALAIVFTACGSPAPSSAPLPRAVSPAATTLARDHYVAARDRLEARRKALAAALVRARDAGDRKDVLETARRSLLTAFADDVMPAWSGTSWDYYGTSATPGEGAIACGHFVGTVLQHLGFAVDRLALGRLASEHILRTFVADSGVMRFSNKPAEDVVARVRTKGPGLYVLGLDHHAAFLWVHDDAVDMCHAAPASVLCEPALTSAWFDSRYRVTGRLFDDAMLIGWLEHRTFVPWTPPKRR